MPTCGHAVISVATISEPASVIHGGAWCGTGHLHTWCGNEEADRGWWHLKSTLVEITYCKTSGSWH